LGGKEIIEKYKYAKIDWFGVNKKYQHTNNQHGFGKHLMYRTLDLILNMYTDINIIVLEAKQNAIPAYKSYGFKIIEKAIVSDGASMFITAQNAKLYMERYQKRFLILKFILQLSVIAYCEFFYNKSA
jgi:ribosomal protein S18 acetylase RimI-like enzyme